MFLSDSCGNCVLVPQKTDILRSLNLPLPPPSAWEPASFVFHLEALSALSALSPYLHCRARKKRQHVLLAGPLHEPHRDIQTPHLRRYASLCRLRSCLSLGLGLGLGFRLLRLLLIDQIGSKNKTGSSDAKCCKLFKLLQVVQVPTG